MNTAAHVLVVEDEPDIRDVLVAYLRRDGYTVSATGDGTHAWTLITTERPALVVLDVMLPGLDGFELLRRTRQHGTTPVIMVTARDEDVDKLVGLRIGADDYVVKPFNPAEVVARVAAVLRRSAPAPASQQLRIATLTIDLDATSVAVGRRPVALTATEYRLLTCLATQPGRTLSRAQLRAAALPDSAALDRVVDAHLTNLRRKLADAGADGLVETVRGFGYRLHAPDRSSR